MEFWHVIGYVDKEEWVLYSFYSLQKCADRIAEMDDDGESQKYDTVAIRDPDGNRWVPTEDDPDVWQKGVK